VYLNIRQKYLALSMPLLFLLVSFASNAEVSLRDALDGAIEKQQVQRANTESISFDDSDFSTWLDGAPFVSLSALRSQDALGTDETELGLTLPIKSMLRRSIEKKLQQNALLLQENASRQQALYLSGQIRELVWAAQAMTLNISTAKKKVSMLERFKERVDALTESRAVPEYIALLLEKESIDSAVILLDQEYQLKGILSEYTRLTGLITLPTNIQESIQASSSYSILEHPDLALLDGAWKYYTRSLEAANQKAEPWNVTLTARRVEVPNFNENQIGLGVEIPISIGKQYTELQRTDYVKMQTEYQVAKQNIGNELTSAYEQAKRDLSYLEAKQVLLDSANAPIEKLEQIIPTLLNVSFENKESVIRSALEVIDARAEIELNRMALQKQISMLKQAAGISI
jgi:hypothetical protein